MCAKFRTSLTFPWQVPWCGTCQGNESPAVFSNPCLPTDRLVHTQGSRPPRCEGWHNSPTTPHRRAPPLEVDFRKDRAAVDMRPGARVGFPPTAEAPASRCSRWLSELIHPWSKIETPGLFGHIIGGFPSDGHRFHVGAMLSNHILGPSSFFPGSVAKGSCL